MGLNGCTRKEGSSVNIMIISRDNSLLSESLSEPLSESVYPPVLLCDRQHV